MILLCFYHLFFPVIFQILGPSDVTCKWLCLRFCGCFVSGAAPWGLWLAAQRVRKTVQKNIKDVSFGCVMCSPFRQTCISNFNDFVFLNVLFRVLQRCTNHNTRFRKLLQFIFLVYPRSNRDCSPRTNSALSSHFTIKQREHSKT